MFVCSFIAIQATLPAFAGATIIKLGSETMSSEPREREREMEKSRDVKSTSILSMSIAFATNVWTRKRQQRLKRFWLRRTNKRERERELIK